MKKKENKVIAFLILFITILLFFIVILLFAPLQIKTSEITVMDVDEITLDESVAYYELCSKEPYVTTQVVRKIRPFPTDNVNDYKDVYIHYTIKNNSIMNQKNFSVILRSSLQENSNIIYKNGNPFSPSIPFLATEDVYVAHLLVYQGNMTDDEFEKYLKKQSFDLLYDNSIMNRKIEVNLENAKMTYTKSK